MKKVFIYACEQTYGGYHGINTFWVDEVEDSMTEEDIYAAYVPDASYDVMNSYGSITEEMYAEAEECCEDEDEISECVAQLMDENVDGYVAFIRDDVTLSVRELDEIASTLGPESFVDEYCVKAN